MPPETLYPTKTLRYNLCKFFLNKRIDEPGLGGPISIRLQEMGNLLKYAQGDTVESRIESLGRELSALNVEWFGPSQEREVINITGLHVSKKFIVDFENNETIIVRCLSKNIEDYMRELRVRTQAARRHYGLSEIIDLSNGGIEIILGDRKMRVGKSKKADSINLRSVIVKLMFGDSIDSSIGLISIPDYNKGDIVSLVSLLALLRRIEGVEEPLSKINNRSITDALIGLNDRAEGIFEHSIINVVGDGLQWVL